MLEEPDSNSISTCQYNASESTSELVWTFSIYRKTAYYVVLHFLKKLIHVVLLFYCQRRNGVGISRFLQPDCFVKKRMR